MADQKLTELDAITSASDDDILYIVDDPGASPVSKKITASNLLAKSDVFSIPYYIEGYEPTIEIFGFPDSNSNNRIRLYIPVPENWNSDTDITIKLLWTATSTGLVDFETYKQFASGSDEQDLTEIETWTDNNLTWTAANKSKVMTITIPKASLAAGGFVQVYLRRVSGDANTGETNLLGCNVYTGLIF